MFTKDEFDMLSLRCEPPKLILRFGEPQRCEPPKLILRFGEPQPFKLDILSLRANSI